MNNKAIKYVNLFDIIGEASFEYGIPVITIDELILLGKKVVRVYDLEKLARKITFEMLCYYIKLYISTPFGNKVLLEIIKDNKLF